MIGRYISMMCRSFIWLPQLGGLQNVWKFYYDSLRNHLAILSLIVILGFLTRIISILTFALVIKIFLSLLDPVGTTNLINNVIKKIVAIPIDQSSLTFSLMIILSLFIVFQFLLGKFYSSIFLGTRHTVLTELLETADGGNNLEIASLCYDYYQYGFESLIKSLEIVVFYFFLIVFVFYVNFAVGVSVVVLVVLLVSLLVFRDRKEAFVQDLIRQSRGEVNTSKQTLFPPLSYYDEQLSFRLNSTISSEFLGGIVILFIFVVYSEYNDHVSGYSLVALLLVFAIRFAVLYAGELSRQLGIVLRLRTVLSDDGMAGLKRGD